MISMNIVSHADVHAQHTIVLVLQDQHEQACGNAHDVVELMRAEKFTGKTGQVFVHMYVADKHVVYHIYVGCGKKHDTDADSIEHIRRAIGTGIKTMQRKHIDHAHILTPNIELFELDAEYVMEQIIITAQMAAYSFDQYKTSKDALVNQSLTLTLVTEHHIAPETFEKATLIARAVNQTRTWIDVPPSDLTPTELATKAESIAQHAGLKITVFGEPEVKKMGMGGLAGVSSGSHQDCKFVILEYNCGKKDAPTIAFVGKGITFDSGGLSLKPADSMETMKDDMSGAAAVINSLYVIGMLKPEVNVIGIAPLSENLPGGQATKPGDVLRFYNGKTAEVLNTDAEGRLILADALSYAVKHYKPDAIIDIATLTGACMYALGPFYTGMMGTDRKLLEKVAQAGDISGDWVWELPFHEDYAKAIKNSVADMQNIGSPKIKAGAITAGKFLQEFVEDTPWVHLDIAGTAFQVPDRSYYSSGATGVGVRLLVELAMNWK
jgi:leucyl aminopeptidase